MICNAEVNGLFTLTTALKSGKELTCMDVWTRSDWFMELGKSFLNGYCSWMVLEV